MLLWDIQAESPALDHPMILLWLLCECAVSSLPSGLGAGRFIGLPVLGGMGNSLEGKLW